jgi:hypothetical protein
MLPAIQGKGKLGSWQPGGWATRGSPPLVTAAGTIQPNDPPALQPDFAELSGEALMGSGQFGMIPTRSRGAPIRLAGFVRFQLGDGIEKQQSDFAAEVAAAAGTSKAEPVA